jgi:hypothetical protein
MALPLSVPQLSARDAAGIELDPVKVGRWLEDLPLLNVAETSRKLFSTLATHNRVAFDDAQRLALLELFRRPVRQISLELTKQYIGLPLPLAEKHKSIAEQNRQFHLEMANGYKRLALNATARNDAIGSAAARAALARVIQRAIRHLTEVLAVSFQTYSPHPMQTWKEIHALYSHAENFKLTAVEVDDPLNMAVPKSSIDHAYKQALLLDFSDPYTLPPRMVDRVHHYLDRWAPLAQLTAATAAYEPTCQFLIDPEHDQAGAAYTSYASLDDPKRYRLLKTVELARQVYTQLTLLKGGQMPPPDGLREDFFVESGQEVLRRMLNAWGVNPQRSFRRNPRTGHQVEMAIGLEAISHWINGGRKFVVSSTFVGPMPQRTSIGAEPRAPDNRMVPRDFFTWDIEDESAGGLSLSMRGASNVHIQVGDLIITRTPGQGNPWSVGVIRWVRSPGSSNVEIGIQRLAPSADPVVVKTVDDGGKESDFLPALLLPEIKPLKQPQSLVTHRGVCKPDSLIYMDNGYRLYKIEPAKLIEAGHSFEQFRFEILNP